MPIVLYALTASLYAGLAFHVWLGVRASAGRGAKFPGPGDAGMAGAGLRGGPGSRGRRRITDALMFCVLVSHGWLLHETIFPGDQGHIIFGFAHALSVMLWLGACLLWVEGLFLALDGLRLLVLPVALLTSLLPLAFPGGALAAHSAEWLFKLHFLIANAAYGLLTLAALHALLMMMVEHRLHQMRGADAERGWLAGWLDTLPPLLTLERLLFRLIASGFVMLTLTLASGMMFSEDLFGRAAQLSHKTVFALVSWLMFGALLTGRHWRGWRGRAALRWVVAAFMFLLLAYVGSHFVLEVLLHRS